MSDSKERILAQSVAELSYKEVLGILARRKWIVVAWVVVGLAVAVGVSAFVIKPLWVAQAQILVPGRTITSPGMAGNDLISNLEVTPFDSYDVTTQIQLLQSNEVLFRLFQVVNVPIPQTTAQMENSPRIEANQIGDTNVIAATVSAPTDTVARNMAQQLPLVYEEFVKTRTTDVVDSSIKFLQSRVDEEDGLLEKARADLADYQKKNGVTSSQAETQINASLIQSEASDVRGAEAAVEGAVSALAKTRDARRELPPTVALPVVHSNVTQIEQEKRNLQTLQTTLDGLTAQYYTGHPLVKAAQAQVDSQKEYLASIPTEVKEIQTVRNPQIDQYDLRVAQAESDLAAARARLESLEAQQREQTGNTAGEADKLKGLTDKEKDIANHEATVQQLKSTLDALKLKTNQLRATATSVNPSTIAVQTQPNWGVNLGVGAALGLLLGVLGAIMRDFNQDKVLNGSTAAALAETYVLARVPRRLASAKPIMTSAGEALSFEAYRLLRTNILAGEAGKALKTIVVTASTKGEGASTVAGNLAVALAQEGKKTLLIEANMRDPVQERYFELAGNGGLSQVLSQGGDAAAMALDSGVSNLKVLVAGGKSTNATEALASTQMDAVLTSLKSAFDYIVIDAPAAYTTADAHEVGRKCDAVIFVVESGQPSKSQLVESVSMLRHAGGKLLGLVMNKDKGAADRIA